MHASDVFEPLNSEDSATLVAWLTARYGLSPSCLADHQLWQRPGAKPIWVTAARFAPPPDFRCETMGIMVMRKMPPAGKLTSTFLQRFGQSAKRNVVRLEGPSLERFIARDPVPVRESVEGYQIVFAGNRVLGAGFAKSGQLRSQLPKAWTAR
ncbi:MAG: hypothetical protein KC502_15425 [Myxococcales bacterium]|nr:hypothetical protein [Myxococcales bacterium]